ncbi:MogA/MoaB family molybdenum cofactor biosynthesis protein [Halorhabdus rudnickae]|uniref:MogA/MoaB family molybdenum cofactor biosynthesis protein n=1 Tax=Halorhabdus rudnickae TaxID=1775544 RepID=UPI00108464C8|nr:molybdopterin-binding protein [Halorhabdus rudnickae]
MVDFQSRDTSRGSSTEEHETEPEDTDEAEASPEVGERTGERASDSIDRSGLFVVTVDVAEATRLASEGVCDRLEANGQTVIETERVDASHDVVQATVDRTVARRDVEAVVTVGGTGVGDADVTVEAVEPLLEKELPGFGELFRVSYHERVGTDVVAMRPLAGISDGVPVFCLPGDPGAAEFATEEILLGAIDRLLADAGD